MNTNIIANNIANDIQAEEIIKQNIGNYLTFSNKGIFWECFSCCASYKNYNYLFKIESRGLRQFIISCYICKYRYTQEYRDLYFLSSITIAKPKSILI